MKRLKLVLLFLLLISAPAVASDWISLIPDRPAGSAPEINVLSCTAGMTVMEIVLPGFYVENTPEGAVLTVPGWATTELVGLPELPAAKFLMALPSGETVRLEVTEGDLHTFNAYRVRLLQEPQTDLSGPAPVPDPRPFIGNYPAVGAEQGNAGHIAALPVTSIKAYPFHVNAESGVLSVSSRTVVRVHHDQGTGAWPAVTLSNHHVRRCAETVINFQFVPKVPVDSRAGTEYLIVTTTLLKPAILPLAEWRNKAGYKTEVRIPVSPTSQNIKNIIFEYPDLDYVLLVGDQGDLPMYSWSGYPGDHWYACTTGGVNPDVYADLSIGRICGSDTTRITHAVDKILGYEKSPPLGPWLKNTILVAHKEQYPYKYTQCKDEIATAMASYSDWNVIKYYGGQSGKTNAGVNQLINTGVNLLNYRGHGDTQEWWSWNLLGESYYNSDVFALTNGDMLPVVLNIACYCGDIAQYCLSEAWIDHTGGAVASLGATKPSYTIPNHDYDKKIYEAVFQKDITDIGGAMDYATDYIINNHGSIGVANAKMYLWLGDPAMCIWRVIPDTLDAAYPATIDAGSQSFEVTVTSQGSPLAGVQVCCFKDGEVYEVGLTGADGKATLLVCPTTGSEMFVTATHLEYLPHEGQTMVGDGTLHMDTDSISARNGGTVNFTLEADVANANRNYIMLGSVSGTEPGTPLPGGMVTLPLNFDPFTNMVIALMNTPLFLDFMGTLDAAGQAAAQFQTGPVDGSFVGVKMYFAYALNVPWNFVSNPVAVKIDP